VGCSFSNNSFADKETLNIIPKFFSCWWGLGCSGIDWILIWKFRCIAPLLSTPDLNTQHTCLLACVWDHLPAALLLCHVEVTLQDPGTAFFLSHVWNWEWWAWIQTCWCIFRVGPALGSIHGFGCGSEIYQTIFLSLFLILFRNHENMEKFGILMNILKSVLWSDIWVFKLQSNFA